LCAGSDGIGGSASTAPEDWFVVVDEMEVIISPIDEWVNGGEPGFTEDQVVIGEGVGKGTEFVEVVIAADGEGGGR
jgi:hypothetical protein